MPFGAALALLSSAAMAGPPYETDDPVPTDPGHWEIYGFAAMTKGAGVTEGEAGVDVNYGAADNLQLTLVIPVAYEHDAGSRAGLADVEVAAKYRFARQASGSPADIAFFPAISLPTGRDAFSENRITLFVPLWAQRDMGPWSLFGGGGRHLRPGRDTWLTGVAVTRSFGDRLTLGGEVFHETSEERGGRPVAGANFGVTYRLTERWSVLGAAGPGLQNRREAKFNAYVALKVDY